MCATDSWGAHESFMYPIFVLKNGCDTYVAPRVILWQNIHVSIYTDNQKSLHESTSSTHETNQTTFFLDQYIHSMHPLMQNIRCRNVKATKHKHSHILETWPSCVQELANSRSSVRKFKQHIVMQGHKVGDDEAGLPTYLDSVSSFYLEHHICVKHHH
jgi:hypothetical protein